MSNRVAKVLGQILEHLRNGNTEDEKLLMELIKQLIEIGQNGNAPAGNRDISKTKHNQSHLHPHHRQNSDNFCQSSCLGAYHHGTDSRQSHFS